MLMKDFKVIYIFLGFLGLSEMKFDSFRVDWADDEYYCSLQFLLIDVIVRTNISRCLTVVTDDWHKKIFDETFFKQSGDFKRYSFIVSKSEDLASPTSTTIKLLKDIKDYNCDLIFIILFNGLQLENLLEFSDDTNLVNFGVKYIFLEDQRLFKTKMHSIWRKIVSARFIRRVNKQGQDFRFDLVSVITSDRPRNMVIRKKIGEWRKGKFILQKSLFPVLQKNWNGLSVTVVVEEETPMVMKAEKTCIGIEIDILNSISHAMNFTIDIVEHSCYANQISNNTSANVSCNSVIQEMLEMRAELVLGNLYYTTFNLETIDMTIPHSIECLTFLTPETTTRENMWKTLISPFNGDMWCGVISLAIFVGCALYYISHLCLQIECAKMKYENQNIQSKKGSNYTTQNDIFQAYSNCLLSAYSMLVLVSLPKMPKTWPVRLLTGWYWIYCVLIAVVYRASFTAILANPSPRITIDTLQELAETDIIVWVSGDQNRRFFRDTGDDNLKKIELKIHNTDINKTFAHIWNREFALYGNEYYLRTIKEQRRNFTAGKNILHIMRECAVKMPISIGLEKNSPMKETINKYIRFLSEGGLIQKYWSDHTSNIPIEKDLPQEAVINLKKFWSSFILLGTGYTLGICAFLGEQYHFRYVVKKHFLYDPLNPKVYYDYIRYRKSILH